MDLNLANIPRCHKFIPPCILFGDWLLAADGLDLRRREKAVNFSMGLNTDNVIIVYAQSQHFCNLISDLP